MGGSFARSDADSCPSAHQRRHMEAAVNSSTLILSAGRDPALLGTRSLILRSAGYIVESAYSIEDAITRFRGGAFDLVVLCHSIPERERKRLIFLIRECGAVTPVLFVTATAAGLPDGLADLSADSDPWNLLRSVRSILESSAPPPQKSRSSSAPTGAVFEGENWRDVVPGQPTPDWIADESPATRP
jgi:CheY-like chemotaxis protein